MTEAMLEPKLDERYRVQATIRLREQFEPIVTSLVDKTTESEYDAARASADHINTYEVPYGRHYVAFPFNMFQDRDIPDKLSDTIPRFRMPYDLTWSETDDLLRDETFDHSAWRGYESRIDELLFSTNEAEAEDGRALVVLRNIRKINAKEVAGTTRQLGSFIFAYNPELVRYKPLKGNIVVPIGDYGTDFAIDLARTLLTMQFAYQPILDSLEPVIDEDAAALIKQYTARYWLDERDSIEESMAATVHEGLLTTMQTLAALTLQRVAGYDDPHRLTRDVVRAGLVEKTARFLRPGTIGPLTLSGRVFEDMIALTNNEVGLASEFQAALKDSLQRYREEKPFGSEHFLARTCPLSNENGGIRVVADKFAELLINKK